MAIAELVEDHIKAHGKGDAKGIATTRAMLENLLACSVTATVKLDGTNVGRDSTGALFGRRFLIDAGQESYQNTDLASVRAVDVAKVSELLAAEANIEIARLVVYGELMCNDIYGYSADGLCGMYRAFGLCFEPASGSAHSVAAVLNASGWAAAGFGEEESAVAMVRMSANPRLLDLLNRAGVPTVETVGEGLSLPELVAALAPRMMEQDLEGLVLTLECAGACPRRLKWKISAEPQPACVAHLTALTAHFEAYPTVAAAMPRGLLDILRTLQAVATAPLTESFRQSTFCKNPEKYIVDAREGDLATAMSSQASLELKQASGVPSAMHSALSKFDSLDRFFAAGEKPPAVAQRVLAEMREDLRELGLDVGAAKGMVLTHVGKAFGAWKPASSA